MAVVSIPKEWMGTTMQESAVKGALLRMNPEIHFDMGACLNLWHPFKDSRQNVYYRGRSIGAMDRGTLPEVPIWTTRREMVEVHQSEVRTGEIALYRTEGVIACCLKCQFSWALPLRPDGVIACPAPCGSMGLAADTTLFGWANRPSHTAHVFRKVPDRVILVGWRHTFDKLSRGGIPGVTQRRLELTFGVDLSPKIIDSIKIDEDLEAKMLDRRIEVA